MTLLDVAQEWIIEIAGTIIFILAVINIGLHLTTGNVSLDIGWSIALCILGLLLMGKKALAFAIKQIFSR